MHQPCANGEQRVGRIRIGPHSVVFICSLASRWSTLLDMMVITVVGGTIVLILQWGRWYPSSMKSRV